MYNHSSTMASMFRLAASGLARNGLGGRLCKVATNHNVVPAAFMRRKAKRADDLPKPKPYPYWSKQFGLWDEIFDPMFVRYDDNSRLIFVDGPPSTGKSEFAQKIADEFEMIYLPPPTFDELYINPYGYDLRNVDPLMPDSCKSFDVSNFLADPNNMLTAKFQRYLLRFRVDQHITAVRHILATGQGVVLNKSVYTTKAYMKAMTKAGYISVGVRDYLQQMTDIALGKLLRPHLIIYLDVPPEGVQRNIKKEGIQSEVNSKVFTTEYLKDLEGYHKDKCLPSLMNHSQILIYDWQQKPSMELVYEDIENLDLDSYNTDGLFRDWFFINPGHAIDVRKAYDTLLEVVEMEYPASKDAPEELFTSAQDAILEEEVLNTCPGEEFASGFNPGLDKNLWVKYEPLPYVTTRRTPRDHLDPKFQEFVRKNWEKYRAQK